MVFKETNVVTQKEILKSRTGGEYFKAITLDDSAFTEGVCKAGNPIGADGKVDNATAPIGILLNDVYKTNPNGTLVSAFAVVNTENCKANAGVIISDGTKTALKDIVFA